MPTMPTVPFQTVADVLTYSLEGRALTYWGSIRELHGEPVDVSGPCPCLTCIVGAHLGVVPRLELVSRGVGEHISHVRPTSVRVAPVTPANVSDVDDLG